MCVLEFRFNEFSPAYFVDIPILSINSAIIWLMKCIGKSNAKNVNFWSIELCSKQFKVNVWLCPTHIKTHTHTHACSLLLFAWVGVGEVMVLAALWTLLGDCVFLWCVLCIWIKSPHTAHFQKPTLYSCVTLLLVSVDYKEECQVLASIGLHLKLSFDRKPKLQHKKTRKTIIQINAESMCLCLCFVFLLALSFNARA